MVGLPLRDDPHGEVDRVGIEVAQHRRVVEGAEGDAYARRVTLHMLEEARAEQRLDAARKRDRERALDARRLEVVLAQHDRLELPERRPHRLDERHGPRRQGHAVGGARQEFVAEKLAQATEGAARRRLSDAEVTGGARHATLGEKRVERDEQVQIDAGEPVVVDGHEGVPLRPNLSTAEAMR